MLPMPRPSMILLMLAIVSAFVFLSQVVLLFFPQIQVDIAEMAYTSIASGIVFALSVWGYLGVRRDERNVPGSQLSSRSRGFRRDKTWSDALAGNRAVMMMVGGGALMVSLAAHFVLTGGLDHLVLTIAGCGAAAALFDLALLAWRANQGLYGDNRAEAEELLHFIVTRGNSSDPNPPRRAVRDPLEADQASPVTTADAVRGH